MTDSNKLGMGVMIGLLCDNDDSARTFSEVVGKTITDVSVIENELILTFGDGSRVALYDGGQSCCESRYMSTDDDLSYYVGAQLVGAETKDGPSIEGEYGECHDVEFLEVHTSKGSLTMVNHNEHNGYYGGFLIRCRAYSDHHHDDQYGG